MSTSRSYREFAKSNIDEAIRLALAESGGVKARRALSRMIWTVQGRSDLLRPARHAGRSDAEMLRRIVRGLAALLGFRASWLRPLEEWEPRGERARGVFSSLAHHLLANYPVPAVLHAAWFEEAGYWAYRQQHWFHHVGMGRSLRSAGFPIALTRRMAHEFSNAPAHVEVGFALRWAEVRGLGGSEALANAVASTRLKREFLGQEFWRSLIHLLLNARGLELGQITPIVEYLYHQKFAQRTVIIGEDTELSIDPPRPDLSIKGCTAASLVRRAREWEAERRPEGPVRRRFAWDRSGIREFQGDRTEGKAWTIRELLDSDDLAAEGKAMKHCVATYTEFCVKRRSTIWSLGLEGPDGRRRLATIEVDPSTKTVVQASMKCNEEPDEPCRSIVREWASREGLTVEC
ncbi:PcfJ domain-containing protein [Tautonia sp. JC769]|uniref:PcfJ domain-containing protein n=1 Tax=Tautonia sp. JC769 TaxID=3232135 RepID=UPI00345AED72